MRIALASTTVSTPKFCYVVHVTVLLAVITVIGMATTPSAFSQTVTVEVLEDTYKQGDTLIVSGNVEAIIQDNQVTIQIILKEDSTFVGVGQVIPARDGSFTYTTRLEGDLWAKAGEYVVKATYGTDVSDDNFMFLIRQDTTVITQKFEAKIENEQSTFDVGYAIDGGTIQDMITNKQRFSLVVTMQAIDDDGTVTLQLPKEFIDSKTNGCEGGDEIYIIFIDGIQVPYEQLHNSETQRTISIKFQNGDKIIEVVGTCIIPEFGGGGVTVMVILIIAIVSIIVLSKKGASISPLTYKV